jgi:hypothetical protein
MLYADYRLLENFNAALLQKTCCPIVAVAVVTAQHIKESGTKF